MGFIKQSALVLITAILVNYIPSLFEPKLPPIVEGEFKPEFMDVAETFRRNMESGKEMGAAFAVYLDGEPIIDMWAGYADREAQRRWRNETLTAAYSVTKSVLAILFAWMVDKGYADYSKPISYYWPAFGQKNKDNITLEMFLSHQAGLAHLDRQVYLRDLLYKPEMIEDTLAQQETVWPAGQSHGYHALTYGLYLDRLIQKIDLKSRDTASIFQEEIAQPFGIDFFMNLPREKHHLAARIQQFSVWRNIWDTFSCMKNIKTVYSVLSSPMARKVPNVIHEFVNEPGHMNNPELREILMSSNMGSGTARGLAKLFSIIASGGSSYGKQLLTPEVIQKLSTQLTEGPELILTPLEFQWGRGVTVMKNPFGEKVFGHPGYGGQIAYADPTNKLGIAYLTNYVSMYGDGNDPRFLDLQSAVYRNLERYLQRLNKHA